MLQDWDSAVEDKEIIRLKEQQMTSQHFGQHDTKSLTPAVNKFMN